MKIDVSRLKYDEIQEAFRGTGFVVLGIFQQNGRVLLECRRARPGIVSA